MLKFNQIAGSLVISAMVFMPPLGFAQSSDNGEESAYVQTAIGDQDILLKGIPVVNIKYYASVRNSDPKSQKYYAYTPYFLFVSYLPEKQTLPVRYERFANPDGTYNIKMQLACYDEGLKNNAAIKISQIRDESLQAIQILPVVQLKILEKNSGLSTTMPADVPVPNAQLDLQPIMDVFFRNLSPAQAKDLTNRIDSNNIDFSFQYSFKKSGNVMNSATVTLEDVTRTNTFQRLTGNGGSGFVTRDGMHNVATKIVTNMDIISYVENPSDSSGLLDRVIDLFISKAKFKESVDYARKENLDKLSALSINPNGPDFEADQISATHDLIATSKDYNDVNKKLNEGGGKIGYGPFTADANFKSNEEVLKAAKETFNRDWTGNNFSRIPKTVNIYEVSASDFQTSTSLRMVSIRPSYFYNTSIVASRQIFPSMKEISEAVKTIQNDTITLIPIAGVVAAARSIDTLPTNWLPCDGRPLFKKDYPQLFNIIGTSHGDGRDIHNNKIADFNIPDYRGYFLRGVDSSSGRDSNAGGRLSPILGGNTGDNVGTLEDYATALPKISAFTLSEAGSHSHDIDLETTAGRANGGVNNTIAAPTDVHGKVQTTTVGNHTHTIAGGDMETRPKNVSVWWIIRVK